MNVNLVNLSKKNMSFRKILDTGKRSQRLGQTQVEDGLDCSNHGTRIKIQLEMGLEFIETIY